MASLETRTPFGSFPLAVLSLLALARDSLEGPGVPINHELSNQKFANRHQLFYISNITSLKFQHKPKYHLKKILI